MGKGKMQGGGQDDGAITLHVVLLEWGGQKPPSTWYRRLEQIADIKVRKDGVAASELSSLVNRVGSRNGAVVQEGAILCASYSLARTLRALAVAGLEVERADGTRETIRPVASFLGTVRLEGEDISEQDLLALRRMEAVFSKRGKKGPEQPFAVTCMEEMVTRNISAHAAVNCPVCGGVQVRVRPGHAVPLADPVDDDVFSAWVRLRFGASGYWEKPAMAPNGMIPLSDAMQSMGGIKEREEQVFVMGLGGAPLLHQIQTVTSNRDVAMELLDAAFIARNYWRDERRLNARLAAVTAYFQMGNMDVAGISLAELPQPDLFDTAALLGPERAAALMTTYMLRTKTAQPVFAPGLPSA